MTKKDPSHSAPIGSITKESLTEAIAKHTLYGPDDLTQTLPKHGIPVISEAVLESLHLTGNPKRESLESEIKSLRQQLSTAYENYSQLKRNETTKQNEILKINSLLENLQKKEGLSHLLDRVCSSAQQELLCDSDLLNLFQSTDLNKAFVVSIDLRRSTELMLKARSPQLFASFITRLAEILREIVLSTYGVFDKFTGDGILAFYPEFYSGQYAGLLAVEAAQKCHEAFSKHYYENRNCFVSVLKDTGLGIGIDYGEVSIVRMGGELTVVGTPVVYACRLGGANAGLTLVNQPAYEWLLDNASEYVNLAETCIDFKHEGSTIAYDVQRNKRYFNAPERPWDLSLHTESKERSDTSVNDE